MILEVFYFLYNCFFVTCKNKRHKTKNLYSGIQYFVVRGRRRLKIHIAIFREFPSVIRAFHIVILFRALHIRNGNIGMQYAILIFATLSSQYSVAEKSSRGAEHLNALGRDDIIFWVLPKFIAVTLFFFFIFTIFYDTNAFIVLSGPRRILVTLTYIILYRAFCNS